MSRYQFKEPVSVLLPVYNEERVIESVIEEIIGVFFQYLPEGSEILIDDGGSTDRTPEILRALQAKYPFIRVIWNARKDGFGASARRLYEQATCPIVCFNDSDGQYVPENYWKLAPMTEQHSVVFGAKTSRKDPPYRRLASWVFNRFARAMFGFSVADVNSAFRLMRRSQILPLVRECRHLPTMLNAELTIRAQATGLKVACVSIEHRPRTHGVSRGLPPTTFVFECWKAFRGLWRLRADVRRARQALVPGSASVVASHTS